MMSKNLYSGLVFALAAAATAAVTGCAVGESADAAEAPDPAVQSTSMPCDEAQPPADEESGDDSAGHQYQYPAESRDEGTSGGQNGGAPCAGGASQGGNGYSQGGNGAPQGSYGPPQGNYGPPQGNYEPPQGNYEPPQGSDGYAGGYDDSAGGYGPMSGTYYNQSVTIQTFGPAGGTPVGYSMVTCGSPYGSMGYYPYGGMMPYRGWWRGGY